MAGELAIQASNLGKCYHIYADPQDRLKQFLFGRWKTYYREFWANRGIDLELRRGQTCGIVGRNGAGKTTLLQMLAGTLQPTEGELSVDGRVTSLLELGSGFNGEFTGRENVFLNGAVLGITRAEMEQRFDAIAAFADIGDFLDQPVKTYSSGMFVRLAFSVLANLDPDIFIVDEALAVGDAYFRHRCMHRFHAMQEAGTTILFVSHDASAMKRLCEHVVWLDGGRVKEAGPPAGVVDGYLASLFGQEEAPPEEGGSPEADLQAEAGAGAAPEAEDRLGEPLRFDRRLGDQRLVITGVAAYQAAGGRLVTADPDSEVTFVMRCEDRGRPSDAEWVAGYILRSVRGEDVASANSRIEKDDLGPLPEGETAVVTVTIQIPRLAPGSYSLTPTLAYADREGALVLADQLDNAVVFEVTAERDVFCVLSLPTSFRRDPSSGSRPPPSADGRS